MNLNALEKDIYGSILSEAINSMSNNSCNDLSILCTVENQAELLAFIKEVGEGDVAKAVPGKKVYFTDWIALSLLKRKLLA